MGRFKGNPRITTSITISPEFFALCREHNISFTEAARVGISLMLAERGVKDYDNSLNLTRKVNVIREELEKKSAELENLKQNHTLKKTEVTEDGFQIV